MDFAKRQLLKYGWSEGRGLGRNEDGIAKALKPKLKFDNCGVGHDAGAEFTNNWWERAFNDAANNIDVKVTDKEVKLQTKREDSVDISTKSFSVRRYKESSLEYGTFIKTAKFTDGGTEDYSKRIVIHKPKSYSFCTDEQLFAACKGRTGHKGARHGVKLGGKLSRLEKQEKLLLKKMKKISLSDMGNTKKIEKKFKKINEHKEDWSDGKYTSLSESEITTPSSSQSSLKKKNKKKKKSVSFNETVTKIYTADLDTSFDSEVSSLRDENSNDASNNNVNNNNNSSGSDEGIEQDLENNNNLNNNNNGSNHNNNVENDSHRSFEEARLTFEELSKAERKKLMKKRKYELLGIKFRTPKKNHHGEEKDATTKKRKFIPEESEVAGSVTESPDRFKRKRDKKIRQKHYRAEEKAINSISKSLEGHCRISESD